MTIPGVLALCPLLVIAITALSVLLVATFSCQHRLAAGVTLGGFLLAFATLFLSASFAPQLLTTLLILDQFSLFYMALLLGASISVTVFSYHYLETWDGTQAEFYLLLLLATLGATVLVASNHFVSLFLGLELLTVALYGLIAYLRTSLPGLEAGLKYLLLAAASSAFLLFGMALIYAALGTMEFVRMATLIRTGPDLLVLAGFALVVTGVGFKLALVPFHMWTPDVYEGAPAPVTAFIATVSKGAIVALLLRYCVQAGGYSYTSVFLVFSILATVSMFTGNLLALRQENVKRLLAYSSIAQVGYLLVALLAARSNPSGEAVTYYVLAYVTTILGAFGTIAVLSHHQHEWTLLDEYRGLFWRQPWLASVFAVMFLSLAGIPLTAGFVGKFYVLSAGVTAALWVLVGVVVVNSAIGLFYYLRVTVTLFMPLSEGQKTSPRLPPVPVAGGITLAVLTFIVLWLGVYPAPVMRLIQTSVASLGS